MFTVFNWDGSNFSKGSSVEECLENICEFEDEMRKPILLINSPGTEMPDIRLDGRFVYVTEKSDTQCVNRNGQKPSYFIADPSDE